jgi:hypothetical protein
MRDLSVIDDGHGFKAAMRVLAHASRTVGGIEPMRTRIIKQQERADGGTVVVI